MDRRRDLLQAIAILAGANALLHTLYAIGGGIADPPWRWLLALSAILGAVLSSLAAWRGPRALAWVAWPLAALPVAATWPAAMASWAGIVVVLLLLATLAGLILESLRSRPGPPPLSPG